ncbi:tyrosine phosphatase family-domain-containing protein [Hypoxylon argillaceum]|nr:tyrosine phosphatase family-domain-containing protein [Hypoxylon argillaceum]
MGDFNIICGQPQVAGASHDGKSKPINIECCDENTSQSFGVVSRRNSLAKNILRESQTCTKRGTLGRPISTSHQPPINFSMVSEGLYRSGYPETQDYPFIQSLKLRTIVTLVSKELPDGYQEFIQANRITHKIFDMAGTKKEDIPVSMMRSIHAAVSNPENYPLLVHCNHGKHRTGCVVGVLRKSNQWDLKRIIDEYSAFAEPKVRETDLKYLTDFELTSLGRQPHTVALLTSLGCQAPGSLGRFFRLVIVVILTMLVFYPLRKLKLEEPRWKTT